MKQTQLILEALGITRCHKGYRQTAYAICLAKEDDLRLLSVTKSIYKETAKHFGCSATSVEHNIRSTAIKAWERNPELLSKIARCRLDEAPTSSDFISYMATYLLRRQEKKH